MILLATRQDRTFKETEEQSLKLKNLINLDVLFLFLIINIVILYGLYKKKLHFKMWNVYSGPYMGSKF